MSHNDIDVTFICPRVAARKAELEAAFGIHVMEPAGRASPRDGLIEIGAIIVAKSLIYVLPRIGLSSRHLELLIGAAEMAFRHQPRKADGWRFTTQGGVPRWVSWITAEVDCGVAATRAEAAESRPDRRARRNAA